MFRSLTRFALVCGALAVSPPAFADDAACINSYESTQTLRKAGKLRDARAEAAKCAEPTCPAVLTKDCTKWQTELDATIPTIVVDVHGGDAATAKATANGQPVAIGTPVPVDVGAVAIHVESGGRIVDQTVTLKEGEKAHAVEVTLPSKEAASTPAGAPATSAPIPVGPIVFGGVGVVAVGVGLGFALAGHSSENDLDACKGHCAASSVNHVETKYAVSDILFAAGAVSLAAAVYMFVTRPREPAASAAALVTRVRRSGLALEF